jgi:hypothetical protein
MRQSKNIRVPCCYHSFERDGIFLIGRGQSCKSLSFYSLRFSSSLMLLLNYASLQNFKYDFTMFGQALTIRKGIAYIK